MSQPVVNRWINGVEPPGERLRPIVAKTLGISVDTLMAMFDLRISEPQGSYGAPDARIELHELELRRQASISMPTPIWPASF